MKVLPIRFTYCSINAIKSVPLLCVDPVSRSDDVTNNLYIQAPAPKLLRRIDEALLKDCLSYLGDLEDLCAKLTDLKDLGVVKSYSQVQDRLNAFNGLLRNLVDNFKAGLKNWQPKLRDNDDNVSRKADAELRRFLNFLGHGPLSVQNLKHWVEIKEKELRILRIPEKVLGNSADHISSGPVLTTDEIGYLCLNVFPFDKKNDDYLMKLKETMDHMDSCEIVNENDFILSESSSFLLRFSSSFENNVKTMQKFMSKNPNYLFVIKEKNSQAPDVSSNFSLRSNKYCDKEMCLERLPCLLENLVENNTSATNCSLSWESINPASSDGKLDFEIIVKKGNEKPQIKGVGKKLNFIIDGLHPNECYDIHVKPKDLLKDFFSPSSNVSIKTTPASQPKMFPNHSSHLKILPPAHVAPETEIEKYQLKVYENGQVSIDCQETRILDVSDLKKNAYKIKLASVEPGKTYRLTLSACTSKGFGDILEEVKTFPTDDEISDECKHNIDNILKETSSLDDNKIMKKLLEAKEEAVENGGVFLFMWENYLLNSDFKKFFLAWLQSTEKLESFILTNRKEAARKLLPNHHLETFSLWKKICGNPLDHVDHSIHSLLVRLNDKNDIGSPEGINSFMEHANRVAEKLRINKDFYKSALLKTMAQRENKDFFFEDVEILKDMLCKIGKVTEKEDAKNFIQENNGYERFEFLFKQILKSYPKLSWDEDCEDEVTEPVNDLNLTQLPSNVNNQGNSLTTEYSDRFMKVFQLAGIDKPLKLSYNHIYALRYPEMVSLKMFIN